MTGEEIAEWDSGAPLERSRPIRQRWHAAKTMAFQILEPVWLALVATDGPISVMHWTRSGVEHTIGGNRGVWPAKIVRGGSRRDTATAKHDQNPLMFVGTQFRLWCRSAAHRDVLATAVEDLIAVRAEADADGGAPVAMLHDFADLGPDIDLDILELEVRVVAERLGVTVWDDDDLGRVLDRMVADAGRIAAKRGRPVSEAILRGVTRW